MIVAAKPADTNADLGLRRLHRDNRPMNPTGRAAIGRPSRKWQRSSARLWALISLVRLFFQAFQADRLQISRDVGPKARGGTTSVDLTMFMVSRAESPRNGGRPVNVW